MSEQITALRHSVLLVDDEPRVRYSLALLLRWSGEWDIVGEVATTDEALALAATCVPDIILLDRWLAGGDVIPLLSQLRAEIASRIVLLTAEPEAAIAAQALTLGAQACLDKTSQPLELLHELRMLVDG